MIHGMGFSSSGRALFAITTDPAAGNEISETVPAGKKWKILCFRAGFTSDATVANRNIVIITNNPSGSICFQTQNEPLDQTASQTLNYLIANGYQGGEITTDNGNSIRLDWTTDIVLPSGSTFATITVNLQAGDNWGQPVILVEEMN